MRVPNAVKVEMLASDSSAQKVASILKLEEAVMFSQDLDAVCSQI
jgi:hypothetical protein